jgi:hypothetical protein
MTLEALQHLLRTASAMAEDCRFLVLGSASLLASFPQLSETSSPLASTYDADLCPQPFDELTGTMLEEAMGDQRAYYRRHGYHADILKDSVLDTLPKGWEERLVEVPGCPAAKALGPNDLAAVKLLVGRPKDLALLAELRKMGLLEADEVNTSASLLDIPIELTPRLQANFKRIFS